MGVGWCGVGWTSLILIYPSSFLFFVLVKTCKEITSKLSPICEIIEIQSLTSHLYEIIIYYMLKLAKVTSKQCMGITLVSK